MLCCIPAAAGCHRVVCFITKPMDEEQRIFQGDYKSVVLLEECVDVANVRGGIHAQVRTCDRQFDTLRFEVIRDTPTLGQRNVHRDRFGAFLLLLLLLLHSCSVGTRLEGFQPRRLVEAVAFHVDTTRARQHYQPFKLRRRRCFRYGLTRVWWFYATSTGRRVA